MSPDPVLIAGAGPTGLLLAIWLKRLGTPFRLIDRTEGPGEASRAMIVHARTLEFYRQLGFAEKVVESGLKVEGVSIRNSGRLRGSVDFRDIGKGISAFPFILSFPQDEHEKLLVEELRAVGGEVEWRTELTGLEQGAEGVQAELATPSGTESFSASYVAGCDGAHSAVRRLSAIDLPGGTYARQFFVADAEVSGEAASEEVNLCVSGEDFCIAFPLHRAGSARLIGVVPSGITREDLTFADVEESVLRNTGLTIHKVGWFSPYRSHHRVSERFRKGRVFLLGDAAHLHSPVGGQGMNTGLGDATNLGWKLAAVLSGHAGPTLLDSYEPERMNFARSLVATTDRLFQIITDDGLAGRLWRSVFMSGAMPLAFRLPVVPRRAFRLMSQTEIEYRASPLSRGQVGKVRAGDRLPWLQEAGTGEDNFAPLGALCWQAHVYGEALPEIVGATEARGIPLHAFPFGPQAAEKGLERGALYLVRPDGHVGLALPAIDAASGLDSYWRDLAG